MQNYRNDGEMVDDYGTFSFDIFGNQSNEAMNNTLLC